MRREVVQDQIDSSVISAMETPLVERAGTYQIAVDYWNLEWGGLLHGDGSLGTRIPGPDFATSDHDTALCPSVHRCC
jgi:hypothetical protein